MGLHMNSNERLTEENKQAPLIIIIIIIKSFSRKSMVTVRSS